MIEKLLKLVEGHERELMLMLLSREDAELVVAAYAEKAPNEFIQAVADWLYEQEVS